MNTPSPIADHDLELAALVQRALLPRHCPACPRGHIAADHRMSATVGGDFYDFDTFGPERVGFLMGDVMGHGVASALVMSMVMGMTRRLRHEGAGLADVLRLVNEQLVQLGAEAGEPILSSLFYGIVDIGSRAIEYVNAGHPTPLVCNRTSCAIAGLESNNLLLGVQELRTPTVGTTQLAADDRLVLYSDGIVDAVNDRDERFSVRRLHELASRNTMSTGHELIRQVFAAVDEFTGRRLNDDQSMVVVDFQAEP